MLQDYRVTGNTCHRCKTVLVRVPRSIYPIEEVAPDPLTTLSSVSIAARLARFLECSAAATG
jgi:hypothetical protein